MMPAGIEVIRRKRKRQKAQDKIYTSKAKLPTHVPHYSEVPPPEPLISTHDVWTSSKRPYAPKGKKPPPEYVGFKLVEWLSSVNDSRTAEDICDELKITQRDIDDFISYKHNQELIQERLEANKEMTAIMLQKELYAKAMQGNTQAFKLYSMATGSFDPTKKEGEAVAQEMTEKELDKEIHERVLLLHKAGERGLWLNVKNAMRKALKAKKTARQRERKSPIAEA